MEFVETLSFTRRLRGLLSDDEYCLLQTALMLHPAKGPVIQGSGGIRKFRWAISGRGKRGGVRVIYYWAVHRDILFMLLIYSKNEQDDLTPEQLKILKRLIEEEFS
ncbi:MAG: hypothetical protein A2Z45_11480 [Chloroflexi bacterium RBG_19FT_COMBO_55_16]|nr:MAG: hypothetical protein A2Z45_11480 [Chloroflexi bacterium RBG_19FT_COMBO_55_16]